MQQISTSDAKGFLKTLYDFKFTSFVTSKVIRVIYALVVIFYSIFAVIAFFELIRQSGAFVPIPIIVVPLSYLLTLTIARMGLEFIMVVFRIGEDVRNIRDRGRSSMMGTTSTDLSQLLATSGAPSTTAPGWYEDPEKQARVRYWDGSGWTEHTQD